MTSGDRVHAVDVVVVESQLPHDSVCTVYCLVHWCLLISMAQNWLPFESLVLQFC